jgi:uncharacterized YigZ family protein
MVIKAYKTIKVTSEIELTEKKSVFLAKAYSVSAQNDVDRILKDMKKQYYDASHRCYAYKLLSGKSKFSDAGEPTGTAGIRIMNAIDHFELKDCLAVVIRYFGGTKLGVGSLGKAYYSAAFEVLAKSRIITKKPYIIAEIISDISSLDKVNRILIANQGIITETIYDPEIKLKCLIPIDLLVKIKSKIGEILKGKEVISTEDGIVFR